MGAPRQHSKHKKKRDREASASPFSLFLIDTIISINTIGFFAAFAKCLLSESYKDFKMLKSTITTP